MRRRLILWLLLIGFAWLLYSHRTETVNLLHTLGRGQWEWLMLAGFLQVVFYVCYASMYWSAFEVLGVKSRVPDLLPVTFASIFVNVAAPSGGASGMALFVDDARRRGESASRATIGTFVALVSDYAGFMFVLAIALVYLFLHHQLQTYELVAAIILTVIVASLGAVLVFGLWQPDGLRRLLSWVEHISGRIARRLGRQSFLREGWAEQNAQEFIQASVAVAANPLGLTRTLFFAVSTNIISILSLYSIFRAFHQPVGLGVLIAGFAIPTTFMIVSITPQGIGVVEVVMAAVLTSLGVPADRATLISLAYRGLSFWIPVGIGLLLLRRVKAFGAEEVTRAEPLGVRAVALMTAAMGVINLLSAVRPSLESRLQRVEEFSPFSVSAGGHLTSAMAGFALLVLSLGLWRRKRVAWTLTMTILLVSIIVHLIKGPDYQEAVLAALLAGWLFYLRSHFHARSDVPSLRNGLLTLVVALGFTLLYGTIGFYMLDRHFSQQFGLGAAIRQTVVMFTQFYNPGLEPITGFGRYFADSIYLVGAMTIAYALPVLIRPVLIRQRLKPQEFERATDIIEKYGHTSLARYCLMSDKHYFFSEGGSVLAYALEGRVALTLGDPIGPSQDALACILAYADLCRSNDWLPAFYQVLPENLAAYKTAGFDVLCMGHEGIVELADFTLSGHSNKSLRSSVSRISRLGYTAEVVEPPHPAALLAELRAISDEWLTNMKGSEKRFSLGWFDEDYLNTCPIILIRDPDGLIEAFANVVTEFQANEVVVDMMRHRSLAQKGQMDFLFYNLFEWAKGKGYATFNLALSSLAGIGERAEDPAIERTIHYIYQHVDQFYNFRGLHAFKDKFNPVWSPRYLIYPGLANLPAVVVAILRADSGGDVLEGYIKHPK